MYIYKTEHLDDTVNSSFIIFSSYLKSILYHTLSPHSLILLLCFISNCSTLQVREWTTRLMKLWRIFRLRPLI